MFRSISLTVVVIFAAEALIVLLLESRGSHLSLAAKTLVAASLLVLCLFPVLYQLFFRKSREQIQLQREAEQSQRVLSQSLELLVDERTDRLQRANEDLLVEVQGRAKTGIALRKALVESSSGRTQLQDIINAVCDALVVIDEQWQVLFANPAAETMFSRNAYDLRGQPLKELLLPWSREPVALNCFFSRDRAEATYLIPTAVDGEGNAVVQMRFGAELEWNNKPATVLMFYLRDDLTLEKNKAQGVS